MLHHLALSYQEFWRKHPALLYAVIFLLGISGTIQWHSIFYLLIAALLLPFFICWSKRDGIRLLLAVALGLAGSAYVQIAYPFPSLSEEGVQGIAYVQFDGLSRSSSRFEKKWLYRGTIKSFQSEAGECVGNDLPFFLTIPDKVTRPSADADYLTKGILKEVSQGKYLFKPLKNATWKAVKSRWGIVELRFSLKQVIGERIKQAISHPKAGAFLAGMVTGEFDDRLLMYDFRRFGLQHIMAISGFHFAIIASIFGFLLRLFFKIELTKVLLVILLSLYFLFLGYSASIFRAWVMILIALAGTLFSKKASSLNSLGIAMLFLLMFDPFASLQLGFQFSFAITAAILLLYPAFNRFLDIPFTKRALSEMIQMGRWSQHAYCVLSFFRSALALTFAVNAIAMPLLFFYFHEFPVMSLIYNLFFPFLVSVAMFFLIIGSVCELIWPLLSRGFYLLSGWITECLLTLTQDAPIAWDITWNVPFFSFNLLIITVCIVYSFGVIFNKKSYN
jgi:competence protein ComEC